MPSLYLEDYVFTVVENQARLFDYLEQEEAGDFSYQVDISAGVLTFLQEGTDKPLLTCRAHLLGTISERDNSWFWSWANSSVSLPRDLKKRFADLRKQAKKEDLPALYEDHPFILEDDSDGQILAIVATGWLGAFTFYSAGYAGGTAFLAVDAPPELEHFHLDLMAKIRAMLATISVVPFDHPEAVRAYLGEPDAEDVYPPGIRIDFDEEGRIQNMEATLTPENTLPRLTS